jgi:hypothetical protein
MFEYFPDRNFFFNYFCHTTPSWKRVLHRKIATVYDIGAPVAGVGCAAGGDQSYHDTDQGSPSSPHLRTEQPNNSFFRIHTATHDPPTTNHQPRPPSWAHHGQQPLIEPVTYP